MGQPLSSVASAQWLTPSGRGQSQARLSGLNQSISRRFTAFVGSSRHWAHLWGSGRFHPRSAVPAPPTPHPRPWAPGRRQRARARGHGLLANKPHRPEPLRGSRVEEKPSLGCTRISPPGPEELLSRPVWEPPGQLERKHLGSHVGGGSAGGSPHLAVASFVHFEEPEEPLLLLIRLVAAKGGLSEGFWEGKKVLSDFSASTRRVKNLNKHTLSS